MKSTCIAAYAILVSSAIAAGTKPMTFVDLLHFRPVSSATLSKDGKLAAWVQSSLDWREGKRFTDIYLAEIGSGGAPRRMTFTDNKDESAPAFSSDGKWLGFLSNRDATATDSSTQQFYLMSPLGGEARRISDAPVGSFAFSPDARFAAFTSGREGERQVRLLDLSTMQVRDLPDHATGVVAIEWAPDSSRLYFTSPDRTDPNQRKRMDLRFDVRIVNEAKAPVHLWVTEIAAAKARRLTSGDDITVGDFKVSRNGQWISLIMNSTDRYVDPLDRRDSEAYLYSILSGNLTRLTDNRAPEALPQISPDGQWIALRAPEEFTYFRRNRLQIRPTLGGAWKSVAADWTGDIGQFHWSADSKKIYFTDGVGVSEEIVQVEIDSGKASQVTRSSRKRGSF